jgi:maltokinase
MLVEISYPEGDLDLYHVPLAFYTDPEHRLDHAFVGWWEEHDAGWVHAYDAVHDRDAMAAYLRAFAYPPDGPLIFHVLPGVQLDATAPSTPLSAEQSNSSVMFGEEALLKLFRRVTPGVNPDIEIHDALTRAGSDNVPALMGWIETRDELPLQLGMLQQFLRTASDGWELALTSVRNLFAEADLYADEVGGDFAGEAQRLGEAVSRIHALLAEHFPTEQRTPGSTPRSRSYPSSPSTPRRCAGSSPRWRASSPVPPNASTATCTWARPCGPPRAGRSSTSRASRPSRSPTGCGPTPRGATWPGCCARSTTRNPARC